MLQLTLAGRYLLGRKLRTTLTTLAVVFGVFILFGLNVIVPAVMATFQAGVETDYGQVDVTLTHKTGEAFSPNLIGTVNSVAGVRAAAGSLSRTLNLPVNFFDSDPARADVVGALTLAGIDPTTAQTIHSYTLLSGRFLQAQDTTSAVITTSLADTLGLHLGDTLSLPTAQGQVALTVVGLRPARTAPGNEEVLVTLPEAQLLLDRPGQINTIEVAFNTADQTQRPQIAQALQTAVGNDYSLGALSSATELFAGLRVAQFTLTAFGALAIAMGGFIIFNSFRTLVVERRRDLAMLRAVGASKATVLGLVLAESLLQGALGTLLGIILGYLFGLGVLTFVSALAEQYMHVQIGGPIVSPGLVLLTIILGVGITVLSGLVPALTASQATPLEGLRPTNPEMEVRTTSWGTALGLAFIVAALLGLISGNITLAGIGSVAFMIGLVLVAPSLVQPISQLFTQLFKRTFARGGTAFLAQANLTRQPTRAAITASTIMISLAIIVMTGGMISSITNGFLSIVRLSLGSDYLFVPPAIGVWGNNVGANGDLVARLGAVEGVDPQAISTFRYAASAATLPHPALGSLSTDTAISLLGIDPVAFPRVSGLRFEGGDAATAYNQLAVGRTLILNGPAAATLGLHVGDDLRLATLHGVQTYHIVGIANDYLNAKLVTGYVSQAILQTDFDKTEDVFIQLNLKPGITVSAIEPQLQAIAADYPQFKLVRGPAYVAENEAVFSKAFVSLYFMFALLAVPSLIALLNTLAIGVLARTREIGMLRAVGATQSQMSRMVIAEALLLTALGITLGLLAGLYLGYVLVSGIGLLGFSVTYVFPFSWLLAAIAIGLVFGVLAALFPARQAARLVIVNALRYE